MRVVDTEVLVSEVVGRGTVLAGRYRVLSPVVSDLEGASAWQATDQILDRPVRVRILEHGAVAPALDAARRAALVTDARLVRVLDVGTHEGYGYVVSEQLVGQSLARLVAQGPLTADQARAVVGEAASALEIARRRGVHHLALRPSVLHVSPDGRVLLGGLALDAALLGDSGGDARSTTRADAVGLVRLLYAALTGLWPADPRAPQTPGGETLPPAPIVDGAPVAPADLVPGVPNDLDTLCVVTLGPNDDGPHSPGELVRELEPWGEIRASVAETATLGGPMTAQFPPTGAAAPGGGIPVPAEHDDQDTAPVTVQRQSVRTAFAQQDPPGANRPGTPPPATPTRATGLGAVPSDTETPPTGQPIITPPVFGQPAPPAARRRSAAVVPPPPVAAGDGVPSPGRAPQASPRTAPSARGAAGGVRLQRRHRSGDRSARHPPVRPDRADPDPRRHRRDHRRRPRLQGAVRLARPQRVVRGPRAVAEPRRPPRSRASRRRSRRRPRSRPLPPAARRSSRRPRRSTRPTPTVSTRRTSPRRTTATRRRSGTPRRTSGTTSPGSRTPSATPSHLTQKTTVSTVTLRTNSNGGNVEIRATDAANPTAGPVLASGPFGPETVFTLDPATETQSLVLWITQLPTAADGGFRLELTEIALS